MVTSRSSDPDRSWWELPLLLGLAALFLAPLLRTGYHSDDASQSLITGVLKVEGYSLAEYIGVAEVTYLKGGRFWPLHLPWIYLFFYNMRDLLVYKSVVIASILADLSLFYYLVKRFVKDRGFALFAACLVIPLFQFRAWHDPILGFFCLLQFLAGGVLASLLWLQIYLDTARLRWLALSVAAYLAVMLFYEITYPVILLHLVLIAAARGPRRGVPLALPFVGALGSCVLASSLTRWLSAYDNLKSMYRINTDPYAFLKTLITQTSSALPLSYYLSGHTGLFPSLGDSGAVIQFLWTRGGVAVFVGTLAVCSASLMRLPALGECRPTLRRLTPALFGLLLATLPAVMTSLSFRHQGMVTFATPYLSVYIQYFGAGLLLAALAWGALSRTPASGRLRLGARIVMSVLVAAVAAVTFRANATLVACIPRHEDALDYNTVVGSMWGCWDEHRRNLEAALRAGLMDDVPEHSEVRLSNEYPAWYDHAHSRYFFAAYSGRVFRTVPCTDRWRRDSWFYRKWGDRGPRPSGTPFRVRDVCLDAKTGYVVLSRETPSGRDGGPEPAGAREAGDVRVFVRHPNLFQAESGPAFALVAKPSSPVANEIGPKVVRWGRELSVVRSGRDWGLFSYRTGPGSIDPNALTVALGPVSVEWGDGFYYPDAEEGGWYRWSQNRGVIVLTNVTDAPRVVQISMRLQNRGDAPISVNGDTVHAVINTGPDPVPFEQELTLTPGTHTLEFQTEASLVTTPPEAHRSLAFRVMNLEIRDTGKVRR
jgi:hypothetical protein